MFAPKNKESLGKGRAEFYEAMVTVLEICMKGISPRPYLVLILTVMWQTMETCAQQCIVVNTPGGEIKIRLTHVGRTGHLITPEAPESTQFRPPSIFSAPLPTGSGARALSLAGAFTAIADDATAASWNPGGLLQLQRPEASAVLRISKDDLKHRSADDDFSVGSNDFETERLNYFSLVYPFHNRWLRRNMVVSLNYQEAYDFSQNFTADLRNQPRNRQAGISSRQVSEAPVIVSTISSNFPGGSSATTLFFTNMVNTDISTVFDQIISSEQLSFLEFEQEGIIDAITPSIAFEVTPKATVGVSFNYHQDSPFPGSSLRSKTVAVTAGRSESKVRTTTARTSSGTYAYGGTHTSQIIPFPEVTSNFFGSGSYTPFTSPLETKRTDRIQIEGVYEEVNEYEDLHGFNANFGALWTASRHLSVGFSIDLPWTAEAKQTKTLKTTTTTFNSNRTQVLDITSSEVREKKEVEFTFPLFWALGAVWRWTPQWYTSVDISQTLWSDFSFKAEGEERINPLDGLPHRESPLDDTWSVRIGSEYLLILEKTQIPLRGGFAWEQRPAIGDPDNFYSISFGSGLSIGEDPGKTIVDFAYIYTFANDIQSLVPSQPGLRSNVDEHQVFVSCIQHF